VLCQSWMLPIVDQKGSILVAPTLCSLPAYINTGALVHLGKVVSTRAAGLQQWCAFCCS
jgi:hypothetical protein